MTQKSSNVALLVSRSLLGLIFTVFGINALVPFLPQPPVTPAAGAFLGALGGSGYFVPLLGITEVIAGLLLLSGRGVPVAVTLLAPIIVHILGFHLFLAPGLALPLLVLALELHVAYSYRHVFIPLFTARHTSLSPSAAQERAHPTSVPAS